MPAATQSGAAGELPALPAPLTVAAVARRLGVAPSTLRTWDRRYGLGPSEHTAGAHRRYTPQDVARLEVMRRLTLDGSSPADAARLARALADASAHVSPAATLGEPDSATVTSLEDARSAPASVPEPVAVRALLRAANALDAGTATRQVAASIERRGVVWTWDRLVAPALITIGTRWQSGQRGVEVEHLLSQCVVTALASTVALPRAPLNSRPVILAAADEEQHVLALHALSAALAERHLVSQLLGARVPPAALTEAVRRSGPAAVFVWSQLPETGDPAALSRLPGLRPAPIVVAGGPGWGHPLPPGVHRASDLVEAVALLTRAASA
jgi:DNA-binding transcriptional MerR regulator